MDRTGRDQPGVTRVATLGATFSANKGAASMLQALIDALPGRVGPCRFAVLSTFPRDDERLPHPPEVTIVPCRPLALLAPLLPVAVLCAGLRRLGLPWRWLARRFPALRALADADVVVDVAGISFVDGRGFPILVYNVLMTSLPLWLGRPTVKAAQALGPFRRRTTRAAARAVLPRLVAVGARGERTAAHLAELGAGNVSEAADLAFLMAVPAEAVAAAERVLAGRPGDVQPALGPGDPFVAVAPSAVVDGYCRSAGVDYPAMVADLVDRITADGHTAVLFPHSARPGERRDRMNDVPVCRAVHARLARPERCLLITDELGPAALRALIARSEVLITSRFHAMISALATETPVLVVGWSHKYAEVMGALGLEEWVVDWAGVDAAALHERFRALHAAAGDVRAAIAAGLPAMRAASERNLDLVAAGLEAGAERERGADR